MADIDKPESRDAATGRALDCLLSCVLLLETIPSAKYYKIGGVYYSVADEIEKARDALAKATGSAS